jgi:Cof subfamily protein (haloacid dehalogenase superfamily)
VIQVVSTRSDGHYRLLACDIDNTLVRFPDPPSLGVQQAIRAAVDAGVTVALVTGRTVRRARPVAQALGLTTPIICNHGGSIRDVVHGAMVHRRTLPRALTANIVAWLQAQSVCIFLFDGDRVHRDCQADRVVPDFEIYTQAEGSTYTQDLRTQIPEQTEIVLATSQDRERLAEVYARAQARWRDAVRVLYTHPFGVDLMPPSSKSEALAWLAGQWGIAREEIAAIGDGVNDVDMLAWAGLGVALGDGQPEALAVADVIAPPFDHDGVAWAIERYILP